MGRSVGVYLTLELVNDTGVYQRGNILYSSAARMYHPGNLEEAYVKVTMMIETAITCISMNKCTSANLLNTGIRHYDMYKYHAGMITQEVGLLRFRGLNFMHPQKACFLCHHCYIHQAGPYSL